MEKKKKNYKAVVIAVILLLVLTISVGYAALSGNILVKGTTKVKANSWGLEAKNIANVKANGETVQSDATGYPVIDNKYTTGSTNDKIAITYTAELSAPGDTYEFEFTVENKGSLPVQLSQAPTTSYTDETVDITPYVELTIEKVVPEGNNVTISSTNLKDSRIEKNGTVTYKVKAKYKDGETATYPSEDVQNTAVITLSYEQSPAKSE